MTNQCRTSSGAPSPSRATSRRTVMHMRSTVALSSTEVCTAGWHNICTKRSRRAFPRARSGRAIARRRANLARKVSSRVHFAWLRVGARARAARTRRILRAGRAMILQGRSIHYNLIVNPFQHFFTSFCTTSRRLTSKYRPVYTLGRCGTCPVCAGLYQE